MGKPENSSPPRPLTVPADARWDPKDPGFEWVLGGVDDEGRRHGAYRSWTRDGVLHGECSYAHGKVHGKNTNFHPDGTVASAADWQNGLIMDSVFFRSDAPTPEPFAHAAANVWSVRYYTRDGKTNYTIRYFLRDGTECGPDGNALPPRPASVSPDARWFPDMDRWVDGEIERGTNKQVGHWRWWSREGVLRHEEERDMAGEATLVAQYEADGTIRKRTTRGPDGAQREYYFDDGTLSTRYRDDANGRQIYKGSWYRDGELEEESARVFDGDVLTSVTERGAGGRVTFEARREGPGLACVLYHDDGRTIAATGLIEGGRLTGTWRLFDNTGALRREVDTTPFAIEHEPTGSGLRWHLGKALYEADLPKLGTPEQLAGVDGEPWADIAGCFNDHVEEFPRLLRGLTSNESMVRSYCLGTITTEIEHQGSTYPATAHVIPWLARLLSHPNVDRQELLAVIQTAGENAAPYVDEVRELDDDDDNRIAIEGTHDAVATAWPFVFACFGTANALERRIILVLAKFAHGAKTNILEIARHDSDPAMRACAIDSLTSLPDFAVADALPCLSDKDPLVRAATAIAIASRKGPTSPREVVAALREAVHNWQEIAARFAELPYVDGHVLSYLALATGAVGSPDARSLAQALCERIDEVDGRSAVAYGQGLLRLAFGTGERPFAKRFVEILDTLTKSKQFWVFNVNAHEVLEHWRLPQSQPALASLVAQLKSQANPEAWMHAKMHEDDPL